jgi:hypothetical protein
MKSLRRYVINQSSHLSKKLVFSGMVLAVFCVSHPSQGRAENITGHFFDCGVVIIPKNPGYFAFEGDDFVCELVGNFLRGKPLSTYAPTPHEAHEIALARLFGESFCIFPRIGCAAFSKPIGHNSASNRSSDASTGDGEKDFVDSVGHLSG